MIAFTIPHTPVAWQRAGVAWTKQGPKHYTQSETRDWERVVATYARSAFAGREPLSGPVSLSLVFMLPIPNGWAAWKRKAAESGQIVPTSKPDLDNLEKAVKDALNKIAWADDAQVVNVTKSKLYGVRPRVSVVIEPLPLLPAQVSRRPTTGGRHEP